MAGGHGGAGAAGAVKTLTVTGTEFNRRRTVFLKKLRLKEVDKVIITCHGWPVYQLSRLKRSKEAGIPAHREAQ